MTEASAPPLGAELAPPPNLAMGSLLFAAAHAGALAVSLGGSMLLVRVASPTEIASYLLFVQAATVLALGLQLGLANSTLRLAPLSRGEGGRRATALLRRRLLALQLALWVVAMPLVALAWPWVALRLGAPELAPLARALAGVAAILSLARTAGAYLRAFRRYVVCAVLEQLGTRTLIAAGLLVLFLRGGDVSWPVLAALYAAAVGASVLLQMLALTGTTRLEEAEPRAAAPPPSSGQIARLTTVIGLHGIFAAVLVSADLWVLSATRSHDEVALYGMMLRLLQLVTFSSMVATFVVPQEFSRLHADGAREELEALARTTATVSFAVAAVVAIALAAGGRPFIAVLLGARYVPGWGILLVLVAGRLVDAAAGPAGSLLLMTGYQTRVLLTTCVAGTGTVALAALLALRWGGYGVAVAVSLGLATINAANVAGCRRHLGVWTLVFARSGEWRRVLLQARARLGWAAR